MKFNGPGKSDSVLYHTSKSKAHIFESPIEFFCVRPEISPEIMTLQDNQADVRTHCSSLVKLTSYGICFSRP